MPILDLTYRDTKGSPLTNAEMDANLRTIMRNLNSVHITANSNLDTYQTPGLFHQSQTADALPALKYPIHMAGMLRVYVGVTGDNQSVGMVYQEYTSFYTPDPKVFIRTLYEGQWGEWQQQARVIDTYTHVKLTTPQNFNTLTKDRAYYSWASGTVVTGGSNGPPSHPDSVGAGYMYVVNIVSGLVSQTCVLLINGQKPRIYTRMGDGSTWDAWQMTGSLSSASYLPIANAGDVYVDARGWYRWDGTKYVPQTIVSGEMGIQPGTTIWGQFPGLDADSLGTRIRSTSGDTYLTAIPGPGGGFAGFLGRSAPGPNVSFAAFGMSASTLDAYLLFSKHGSGAALNNMIIQSSIQECGRIISDGRWMFGSFIAHNVQARLNVNYIGGGNEHGMVMRTKQNNIGVAINFQGINGGVCGVIQVDSANSTTVYTTTSDYRVKDEEGEMEPEAGLQTINSLRPVIYRMKGAPSDAAPQRGFMAHELQEFIPEAVTGVKDDVWPVEAGVGPRMRLQGVDYSKIVPHLVAAVQALSSKLEDALNRIAVLEGRKQEEEE